jgi:hypothetical protein
MELLHRVAAWEAPEVVDTAEGAAIASLATSCKPGFPPTGLATDIGRTFRNSSPSII